MKVAEIFESIQGEGFYSGRYTTFVRLAGCNVACPFCDTSEHWNDEEAAEMSVNDILAAIKTPTVVITGGEPLMQSGITDLVEAFCEEGFFVEVETSGAYGWPKRIPGYYINLWVTVSPKEHLNYHVVDSVKKTAASYKFVVTESFQINDVMRLIEDKTPIMEPRIYLQPESNLPEMVAKCIEILEDQPNWRLSPQIHKLLNLR